MAKKLFAFILCTVLVCASASVCRAEDYQLKQVVVLSRHNIRSPLSEKGSLLGDITPHDWFEWTSKTGELSLRGAMLETTMGQYFRLWLEKEGLFPENYIPKDGAVFIRRAAAGGCRSRGTPHGVQPGGQRVPAADQLHE